MRTHTEIAISGCLLAVLLAGCQAQQPSQSKVDTSKPAPAVAANVQPSHWEQLEAGNAQMQGAFRWSLLQLELEQAAERYYLATGAMPTNAAALIRSGLLMHVPATTPPSLPRLVVWDGEALLAEGASGIFADSTHLRFASIALGELAHEPGIELALTPALQAEWDAHAVANLMERAPRTELLQQFELERAAGRPYNVTGYLRLSAEMQDHQVSTLRIHLQNLLMNYRQARGTWPADMTMLLTFFGLTPAGYEVLNPGSTLSESETGITIATDAAGEYLTLTLKPLLPDTVTYWYHFEQIENGGVSLRGMQQPPSVVPELTNIAILRCVQPTPTN